MGSGVQAKCQNCGFQVDMFFGTGEATILLYDIWINELNLQEREYVLKTIGESPVFIDKWHRTACQCLTCHQIFDYRNVELVYGEGLRLSLEPHCSYCGGDVRDIHDQSKISTCNCPKCGEKSLIEVAHILWD